jgi:hypothetical protein
MKKFAQLFLTFAIASVLGFGFGAWRLWAASGHQPLTSDLRANIAGTSIANFGLAPVNPDWVQVTHKSGQPIDGVPSPEWAVFTFLHEPKVERLEQNGVPVWKVTFER